MRLGQSGCVAVVALGLCLAHGRVASAQPARPVHVPLVFSADRTTVRTSACLEVEEQRYPVGRWWETQGAPNTVAAAFADVVRALKAGDADAFRRVSDPAQVAKTSAFTQQSRAYFSQFGRYPIEAVELGYQLNDLHVVFARLKGRTGADGFAPFVFVTRPGPVRFLPDRSAVPPLYQLVRAWFNSQWGPASGLATYCDPAELQRRTHRIPPAEGGTSGAISLRGAPFEVPGALVDTAVRVRMAVTALKDAAAKGVASLAASLPADSAAWLTKWASTATADEQTRYVASIQSMQPFFFFDLGGVVVVYARTGDGVQALYFHGAAGQPLVWSNATRATIVDAVFKQGPLMTAAKAPVPFGSLAVAASK
jgi:hypothetical protein